MHYDNESPKFAVKKGIKNFKIDQHKMKEFIEEYREKKRRSE